MTSCCTWRGGRGGDHLRMMPLRGSATQWPAELPSPFPVVTPLCLLQCPRTLSWKTYFRVISPIQCSSKLDGRGAFQGSTPLHCSSSGSVGLAGLEFCFEHTPQKESSLLVSSYLCPLMSGLSPSACPSLKTVGRRLSPNCVTEWRGNILLDYLIFSPTSNKKIGWLEGAIFRTVFICKLSCIEK